jgi:transcriptional regulator with XRE-family HTH domain
MVNTAVTPEEAFGVQLRRLREQAGLTVRALGHRLHRAHSGIVEYEGGRRLPGVGVVEQYEDFFELSRGTLLAQRERARMLRLERPRDGTAPDHFSAATCPYPGLRAFQRREAAVFFGREAEVECATARLAVSRFVAVVGASGSGKTSFVQAGLLPALGAATPDARITIVTPGRRPLDALAAALVDGCDAGRVIVVDQLEELFTHCDHEGERASFVEAMLAAWRPAASAVTLIVALRSSACHRVDAYPELAAAVAAGQTLIGPLNTGDLHRAIELPAAASGLLLQPGLTETILEDLAGQPGALPLMAHALCETWKRRRRVALTITGYHEAGGARGVITYAAERTLRDMPAEDLPVARGILLRLTDVREGAQPSGLRVERCELTAVSRPAPATERVLDALAAGRLVTLDDSMVALAHGQLMRYWPRLRGWIEVDRAQLLIHGRLGLAAREWADLGEEGGALLRGSRLAAACDWAREHGDGLSPLEQRFLAASVTGERGEHRAARERAHHLRARAAGMTLLATIVAGLGAWALQQRDMARRKADEATSLALVSASANTDDARPEIALGLAFEAFRLSPGAEARGSLINALTAARDPEDVVATFSGSGDAASTLALSPNGRTLASAGHGDAIGLWDTERHVAVGPPLAGRGGAVTSVAFGPGGRVLASAGTDGRLRVWDVRTGKQLGAAFPPQAGEVRGIAFLRDGHTVVTAGSDGLVRLWDVGSHGPRGAPLTLSDFIAAFAGPVRALSSDLAVPPEALETARAGTAATLSANLLTVAIIAEDGAIRLHDARTLVQMGAPLAAAATSVAFSGDGRTLASAGADGAIRLWDVATRRQLGPPLARRGEPVRSVRFSPDSRSLAASDAGGRIRLWKRILWRNLAEVRDEVCRLTQGGMSAAAWAAYAPGIRYRRSCP